MPHDVGAFLSLLVRLLAADSAVAAACMGEQGTGPDGKVESLTLHLAAGPDFDPATLAADLGDELVYSGPAGGGPAGGGGAGLAGWRLVTAGGLTVLLHLYRRTGEMPAGITPIFDRTGGKGGQPGSAGAAATLDLAAMAGRFWSDFHLAAGAIARGWPLTAHGLLEPCRLALVDLYRLALHPAAPGAGWAGADSLPGAADALQPVLPWLVAPLEVRAQWRSAVQLAQSYESLMLPLCERLGLAYPMAMRNLAFRRLDTARPDRGPEPGPEPAVPPAPQSDAPVGGGGGRLRVVRGRLRREP